MTLKDATFTCFRKALTFSGRASRAEFWKFMLFMLAGFIVCMIVNSMIFGPELSYVQPVDAQGNPVGDAIVAGKKYTSGQFGNVFFLICALPWFAVTWRRMHDISRPGYLPFATLFAWMVAIYLIVAAKTGFMTFFEDIKNTGKVSVSVSHNLGLALIAALILVFATNTYLLVKPSVLGSNKYGPNPNEVTS